MPNEPQQKVSNKIGAFGAGRFSESEPFMTNFGVDVRRRINQNLPVVQRFRGATLDAEVNDRLFRLRFPVGLDSLQTFASGDATPSVNGGGMFKTAGTTAITDFDDGVVGDILYIVANSSITITHNASIIKLDGAANYAMVAGDTLTLAMFDDQVWVEIGRTAVAGSGGGDAWTTVKKTANYTAVDNDEVLCDTATTGAFTVTLPASPTGGTRVRVIDSAGNFGTANLTVGRNGNTIRGAASDLVIGTNNRNYEFVYNATDSDWEYMVYEPDTTTGVGRRYYQLIVFWFDAEVIIGDGMYYLHIPSDLNTLVLVEVHAKVVTAGTGTGTETTDIQIHNVTDAVDMLSTKLTIDEDETGSNTAATPAVINTSTDDVATNDLLRIDIDANPSTTAPRGLIITLGFE